MRSSLVIVLAVGLAALVDTGRAEDWTGFRGPAGSGTSEDKALPVEWSATQNVAWKTKLSGRGWSEPVVAGDKVFVTSAGTEKEGKFRPSGGPGGGGPGGFGKSSAPPTATYKFEVHCLDRTTGKILWSQTALEGRPKIATHGSNTYATETPATDGERVYAYFGMHGVYCYDLAGTLVWKKDLGAYNMAMGWGTASSPVLFDGKLFVQVDSEEKAFLVALDAKTGDEVWKATRGEKSNYASPIIWKNKERTELVTGGATARSYDPATGKVLWELNLGGKPNASPVADGERLYIGAGGGKGGGGFGGKGPGGTGKGPGGPGGGGGGGLFAVKAGASGDVTPKKGETTSAGVAWSDAKAGPGMASPLVYQGHLYILDQNGGTVTCLDATTGKQAYRERLRGAGSFWASPWAYDGKVFCLDDGGTTHVLQAGPTFKLLGTNSIDDTFWTAASLADGMLLLRGTEGVYAIQKKK